MADGHDEWQPTVDNLRPVLGMAAAVEYGDSVGVRALTQRPVALTRAATRASRSASWCWGRPAALLGRHVQDEDVVVQLALELGTEPA